ncbi:MAG: hypothetical protein Q8M02_07600 [Candidatus Didemnitutus sp.]|nr:hypothetical protein [Candidatus Didemnitutus sp.]
MIKSLFLTILFVAFGLVSAMAATDAPMGKVTEIDGHRVKIEVAGELPAWAKKGGYLRAVNEAGKLVLRGAKITDVEGTTLIITSSKANEMKVGEMFTLGKGKASAGC